MRSPAACKHLAHSSKRFPMTIHRGIGSQLKRQGQFSLLQSARGVCDSCASFDPRFALLGSMLLNHVRLLSPKNRRRKGLGFTLVELLVVIGIIALLIGILLPALTRARQASQRTACAAKLHAIMIAAMVHRNDHKDFYPLAGALTGILPQGLGDPYSQFYDYHDTTNTSYNMSGASPTVVSITLALGSEMGYQNVMLDSYNQWMIDRADPNGLSRMFLCPSDNLNQSQEDDLRGPTSPGIFSAPLPDGNTLITTALSSYIFNEYVLGFNDAYGRLRGKASKIRQPASTFFVCDGVPGPFAARPTGDLAVPIGFLTLFNNVPNTNPGMNVASISLGNIISSAGYKGNGLPLGSSPVNFDKVRHQMKMNIAFCDGHVELRNVDAIGLNNVYLMAP